MSGTASDEAWRLLDVAPERDAALTRRAHTDRLKLINPEDDPEGCLLPARFRPRLIQPILVAKRQAADRIEQPDHVIRRSAIQV